MIERGWRASARTAALLAVAVTSGGCFGGLIDAMTSSMGAGTACELRASGVPAQAEILSLWDTGWTMNDDPVVGLRVRVLALDRPPFEADIPKSLIGRLQVARVQPGQRVPVIYTLDEPPVVGLDIYGCND